MSPERDVDTGPGFRLWPPVSIGADPLPATSATTTAGWALVAAFAVWNGWALVAMARHDTALLPGGATTTVIRRGPFAVSRNPLYVGLLVLSAGLALLAASTWALLALPVEWALLRWGAVLPEERYLSAKFGQEYDDYVARVRRWL
jgi:protein-S-isoprenylcysteine O-methyltransferase Ste14